MGLVSRFLVVDDEFVSLSKLKLLLSSYGDVEEAGSGREAMEKFHRAHTEGRPYRLITMDIDMPDMRGPDAVAEIRRWENRQGFHGAGRGVKILMASAMTDAENIMSSFIQGCEAFLPKPFYRAILEEALHSLGFCEAPRGTEGSEC